MCPPTKTASATYGTTTNSSTLRVLDVVSAPAASTVVVAGVIAALPVTEACIPAVRTEPGRLAPRAALGLRVWPPRRAGPRPAAAGWPTPTRAGRPRVSRRPAGRGAAVPGRRGAP